MSAECSKLIEIYNERARLLQKYNVKLSSPEETKELVPAFVNKFKNICQKFDKFEEKLRCPVTEARILRPDIEKNNCDLFIAGAEFYFNESEYRGGSSAQCGALATKVPGEVSGNDFEKKLNIFCEEVNSHSEDFLCELNIFERPKAFQYSINYLKNLCRLHSQRITLLKID